MVQEPIRYLSLEERIAWLRLIRSESVGPKHFQALLTMAGSAEKALEMAPELARRGGRKAPFSLYSREKAEQELERSEKLGIKLVAMVEPEYPPLLRYIADAPPILSMWGRIELAQGKNVAIVGSRHASASGKRITERMAAELGQQQGFVVVSGLARGIDTVAHKASFATGTIAVVAGGIDHIYPPENRALHEAIAKEGLILAELPLGSVPKAQHFPRRNRIISGVARGTVVVEASLRSGSLITARMALEQGREVCAVPGSPLDERCKGTNALIKQGAHLVETAEDIAFALKQDPQGAPQPAPSLFEVEAPFWETAEALEASEEEDTGTEGSARAKVLQALSATAVEADVLISITGLPTQVVLTVLLELEMAGRLARQAGGKVALQEEAMVYQVG